MREAPELEQLFSTGEAATLCGVSPWTIRSWARRGHLTATGHDEHGWPLYRGLDLLHAEHATRSRARRA